MRAKDVCCQIVSKPFQPLNEINRKQIIIDNCNAFYSYLSAVVTSSSPPWYYYSLFVCLFFLHFTVIVIGIAGGVFAALLVTVIIWCMVKQKTKIKHKLSKRNIFKKKNLANGGSHTVEKKVVTAPKIYFHSPTRTDLEQCMVPSEPIKYFPQTDYCSVTDVDLDLYK